MPSGVWTWLHSKSLLLGGNAGSLSCGVVFCVEVEVLVERAICIGDTPCMWKVIRKEREGKERKRQTSVGERVVASGAVENLTGCRYIQLLPFANCMNILSSPITNLSKEYSSSRV